jgi:urease accessory protein
LIKKIIQITKNITFDDEVSLSWFDMQKPNLTACTNKNIDFIIKINFTHLHENDILLSEDGYKIKINKDKDSIYEIKFENHIDFAKTAYEIGNRHQPICINNMKITILNDLSIMDIINNISQNDKIKVNKILGYFRPNRDAHHSH